MPDSPIVPIILCGGAGSRLWPASRENLPKQFLPLTGDDTMLQATLRRVSDPDVHRAEHWVVVEGAARGPPGRPATIIVIFF